MDSVALQAVKTEKNYGSNKALKGVSFTVKEGEIFSLLGKNGAGKTTFIRIATGQLMPSAGTVMVGGFDVVAQVNQVRENIAVVPQEARIIRSCSALEFVHLYLVLRGMDVKSARKASAAGLRKVGMGEQMNLPCKALSGGNRHKLLLACALSSGAPYLFLDEPTIGLDAESRRELWKTMLELRKEGKTIFLTTHYMDEAEVLSDRLAIIDKGLLLKLGTPQEIIEEAGFELRLDVETSDLKQLKVPRGLEKHSFGQKTRFLGKARIVENLAGQAVKKGLQVSVGKASLEDSFIKLVGDSNEDYSGD